VRKLAGVPSPGSKISFSCFYGKSAITTINVGVLVVGGGGAGGRGCGGGGGGGGGYNQAIFPNVAPGIYFSVNIGAGGCVGATPCAMPPTYCNLPFISGMGGATTVTANLPTGLSPVRAYGGGGGGIARNCSHSVCYGTGQTAPGWSPGGLNVGMGGGGGGSVYTLPTVGLVYSNGGGNGSYAGGTAEIKNPAGQGTVGAGGGGATQKGGCGLVLSYSGKCGNYTAGVGGQGYQWVNGLWYGGGGGGFGGVTYPQSWSPCGNILTSGSLIGAGGAGGLGGGGAGGSLVKRPYGSTAGTPGTGGGGGGGNTAPGGPGTAVFIYSSPTQVASGGTVTNVTTLPGSPFYPASTFATYIGCGPYWIHTFTSPGIFTA
jgi:hypothetical protein